MEHVIELFCEDGTGEWRWQCFMCGAEKAGFGSLASAESSAAKHQRDPGQEDGQVAHDSDALTELADEIEAWLEWFGPSVLLAEPIRLAERLLDRGYRKATADDTEEA